jgi:hypothetical protein
MAPPIFEIGLGVAATQVIYGGALVAKNSSGFLVPAAATAGLRVVGWAELENHPKVDTTGLADGAVKISVRMGIFPMKIGTSTDAVTAADEGNDVYVLDDQTISRLPGAGRPIAGQLFLVETGKAWVGIGINTPNRRTGQGTAWQGPGSVEAAVASGAVSVNTEITTLNLATGAQALTLANGLFLGQRKTIVVVQIAGSPVGTLTPATPSGFATVTALGAVGDSVELIWAGAGAWYLANSFGCTFT